MYIKLPTLLGYVQEVCPITKSAGLCRCGDVSRRGFVRSLIEVLGIKVPHFICSVRLSFDYSFMSAILTS